MTIHTLRLHHSDMLRTLDHINLLEVIAQELMRRVNGPPDPLARSRTATNNQDVAVTTDMTTIEHVDRDHVCQLPTPSLQMIGLAGLASLAGRTLLPAGGVTATVFGSGAAAQLHLGLIARYLPNISHAAAHPAAVQAGQSSDWNVARRLEQAGISLSISTDPRQAALGANFMVIAEHGWDRLDVGPLPPGVLVINATRRDVPDTILAQVDRIYVDDITQLEHNQHRKFVRLHLNQPDPPPGQVHSHSDWWHRPQPQWRQRGRIDTDLGHVLTGRHQRADVDDVLLVELLCGATLDVHLAIHIYNAATALGLGRHIKHPRED